MELARDSGSCENWGSHETWVSSGLGVPARLRVPARFGVRGIVESAALPEVSARKPEGRLL